MVQDIVYFFSLVAKKIQQGGLNPCCHFINEKIKGCLGRMPLDLLGRFFVEAHLLLQFDLH